jgi:opacity protein-like surface antigen
MILRLQILSSTALLSLLAVGCASTSAVPRSQLGASDRGFYAKAFGGYGLLESADVDITGAGAANGSGEGEFDNGFMAGAAVGYQFDDSWSLELDYSFRTNDVDSVTDGGTALADGGDYASTALMLNAYYAFDTDWQVRPYVGLGFGYATEIDIDDDGPNFSGGRSYSGESPAAQFMVGGETDVTEDLSAYAEFRFFRAFDPELDGEDGAPGTIESEYGHYGLMLGLNYSF